MNQLDQLTELAADCLGAAWVDTRTGQVLEQRLCSDDPALLPALQSAAAVVSERSHLSQLVLFHEAKFEVVARAGQDPKRVLVASFPTSANLGLAVNVARFLAAGGQS
ncbi:MAG TPA: hypothetical protein VH083_26030 [Myxococcales bacterium]|nr:hypothetical protein [Myxococcales bacterium]